MSQEINISLVSKETPTVNLSTTASGDVQATVGDTTPIVSFIATGEKGATGATGSASITDGSITNAKLASGSVSNSKLASASVSSIKLRENAVTTTKIADHAVTAGKIALGSLTEALIDIFADGAIKPGKLKPGSLLEENFAAQSVGTNVIKNEAVTAGKLANGIIETIKIVDNAVTTAKIATDAVTGNEIQNSVTLNGTVTLNHLDLSGSSPAVITGPDADALHIKTNTVVNFLNTSDTIVASVDQQGNLTLSGTVDGIDLAVAVPLNTAKVGITPDQANAIIANTIKTGITTEQASAITANTNKTGITTSQASAIVTNTAKTGISTSQASAITANTAKTGITTSQANAITANTAKPDLTVDGAGTVHANNYTDTVYTHPTNHAISVITGLQSALDAKQGAIGDEDLTIVMTDGLQDALDAKVDDSQVLTNVPANAVFTDTTYSVQDGELSQNNFTDADHTKLNGIEASADVTDTANVTSSGALMDSELTDLAGVKGVTISTLQVKPSEGAFANGDKTKLDAIEASADVTDAANVTAAGALMDSELTDLAGVKGVTISTLQVKPSEGAFANGDKTKLDSIEASATADQTQAEINALGITAVGISGPTGGDVLISTDGSISVILDNDDDENAQFFEVRNSATGSVFSVGEDGNVTLGGTVDGRDVSADGSKLDGIENGATADQTKADIDALGIAATIAVGLTAGDKTIQGNLRLGGPADTSNNWLSIDAQNGNDSSGGGITFYETGTYDVDSPQYGAKIVYNEDADEFAIGTMHNNVFMRQIYFIRGIARTYFNGDLQVRDSSPAITIVDTSTTVTSGDVVGILNFSNEDDDGSTLRIQAVATEDHASGANGGTKLEIKTTPNGSSAEAVALTVGEDKSLTSPGLLTSMQRHLLRCGFYGNASRMYMPFNYGGPFESTSTAGYSEYGAVIMPCDGYVESVIIRSENACGNSIVTILVASDGTEVPSLSPGSFASPTVNMAADDTSYKFTGFVNQGGTSNSFSAGDVIMIAFDPTSSSYDTTATAVLVFDWNNQL